MVPCRVAELAVGDGRVLILGWWSARSVARSVPAGLGSSAMPRWSVGRTKVRQVAVVCDFVTNRDQSCSKRRARHCAFATGFKCRWIVLLIGSFAGFIVGFTKNRPKGRYPGV